MIGHRENKGEKMDYTQRENLINGLREAMFGEQVNTESTNKHYDAGTGTLYLFDNKYSDDMAAEAVQYFKKKIERKSKSITPKNQKETEFCKLAISCIKKEFNIK